MDIKLPRLGEGVESGTVISILVKEGDQIKEGQTILELENEKAVAPIPASASGRIDKLYVKEGDKLSVGQPILALTESEEKPAAAPKEEAPAKPSQPAASAPRESPRPATRPAEREATTTETAAA